jgi:hypothetical protein
LKGKSGDYGGVLLIVLNHSEMTIKEEIIIHAMVE